MSTETRPVGRNAELDTWIAVDLDGTITVRTGKAELGQGIVSAIARIAAEELDLELVRIRVETADTAHGPDEFLTAGSQSLATSGATVRLAAASARAVLLELAAARLGDPIKELSVSDGVIAGPGGTTSYWELHAGRPFARSIDLAARPKPPERHAIVGRRGPRADLESIVTGTLRYVQDLALPGMLHGRVVRPPGPSAQLESLAAGEFEGVRVVRDGSFVGVLAEREELAARARDLLALRARWATPPPLPPWHRLRDWLLEQPTLDFEVANGVIVEGAAVMPHEHPADTHAAVSATFSRGYQMHASIGPSAALARWARDCLTVWTHSQGVSLLRVSLAEALAIDPETVRAIHVRGPGCYGHNGADDAALDAALLAREVPGRPVLLKWTRADEHGWEPYGPATAVETSASLDSDCRVVDWSIETCSQTHGARPFPAGDRSALLATWHLAKPLKPPKSKPSRQYHGGVHRNADPLYAVGHRRIVKRLVTQRPLRTSSLRALGAFANVFAIESTFDELAAAADSDPIEFRLSHLEDPRARAVLEAAAQRAGWGVAPEGEGRGRGVGFARYKNLYAYAAVIADVTVDDATAGIRVERAVVAADAGEIVDPDGLANQLEGGVVQATSWTLKEEVTFDEARVTSLDWESYPILTFDETPDVETVLLDRPGEPFLGAGEAAQGPTAAAIANAVYDAIGIRLRDIPFTPERVRRAAAAA